MSSIEERLYLETDSSCANCGLRDSRALTVHHIDQSEPKNEAYDNKILLCHNCHQCHHQGKGPSTEDLKTLKKRLIIKTLTRPGLNAMKEAYRKGRVLAMPFLVNHLLEFRYLEKCADHTTRRERDEEWIITAWYSLTPEGNQLLENWRLK